MMFNSLAINVRHARQDVILFDGSLQYFHPEYMVQYVEEASRSALSEIKERKSMMARC